MPDVIRIFGIILLVAPADHKGVDQVVIRNVLLGSPIRGSHGNAISAIIHHGQGSPAIQSAHHSDEACVIVCYKVRAFDEFFIIGHIEVVLTKIDGVTGGQYGIIGGISIVKEQTHGAIFGQ